jgi:hypothetical protein
MRSLAIGIGVPALGLVLAFGCGGDDGSRDGANGAAGSSAEKCPALNACGGDPVAEWAIDSVCVGNQDKLFSQLVNAPECAGALKSTRDVRAGGSYKLGADMSAVSNISVSGSGDFVFNDACVKALNVAQSAAADCSKIEAAFTKDASSPIKSASCKAQGADCACTVMSVIPLNATSKYTLKDNAILVDSFTQPFCVEAGKITLQTTDRGVTLTFTGTKK